jgi:hypothetical protein
MIHILLNNIKRIFRTGFIPVSSSCLFRAVPHHADRCAHKIARVRHFHFRFGRMSQLSEYQVARCLRVLDSLQSYRISSMFAQPIDPERDNVPTYLQIIRHPMDLGTVRKKLSAGQYQTIRQWKEDVDLIWANSYQFNGRASLVCTLAKQLQQLFRDLTETLTDDPVSDWVTKLDALKHEADRIGKLGPKPATGPKTGPKTMLTRQQADSPKAPPREVPQAQTPPPPKRLTEAEVNQLADEVNDIDDPEQIAMIIDLIRKNEPQLSTNGEELEIEVSKLRHSTLLALRALVSQIR